jgi:hypothetical protein
MKLHTDRIPKWAEVMAEYPAIQVERYAYVRPFKEGVNANSPDEITIRVVAKYNNQIFEETYIFQGDEYDIAKEIKIVRKLRKKITEKKQLIEPEQE